MSAPQARHSKNALHGFKFRDASPHFSRYGRGRVPCCAEPTAVKGGTPAAPRAQTKQWMNPHQTTRPWRPHRNGNRIVGSTPRSARLLANEILELARTHSACTPHPKSVSGPFVRSCADGMRIDCHPTKKRRMLSSAKWAAPPIGDEDGYGSYPRLAARALTWISAQLCAQE